MRLGGVQPQGRMFRRFPVSQAIVRSNGGCWFHAAQHSTTFDITPTMSTPYVLTVAQCKELAESFVSPFTKASSRKRKRITWDAVDAITPSDASSTLRMEIKHVCTQRLSPADKPDCLTEGQRVSVQSWRSSRGGEGNDILWLELDRVHCCCAWKLRDLGSKNGTTTPWAQTIGQGVPGTSEGHDEWVVQGTIKGDS